MNRLSRYPLLYLLTGLLLWSGCSSNEPSLPAEEDPFLVQDLIIGEGDLAADSLTVTLHLVGQVKDGAEFINTTDGDPVDLLLGFGCTLLGLEQGLQGMKVGGKRKLTIPSNLAYGINGSGDGTVPPNTTIILDVELLEVKRDFIIEDLEIGTGETVFAGALLTVNYTGRFTDGRVFDTTDGASPIQFLYKQTSGLIIGWQKGFDGMAAGGVRRLTLPPHLAYGSQGSTNGTIPPNTTLVFDLQLVDVR